MNKRKIRDGINMSKAILLFWIYLPHIAIYFFKGTIRIFVDSDLDRRVEKLNFKLSKGMMFLYYIHNDRYFRNLFYHRIQKQDI